MCIRDRFWPTVIVALVDPSIVCIIEPCFPIRRGILVGEILTNSPESIFHKLWSAIEIKGSRCLSEFAIFANIISPLPSLSSISLLVGYEPLPNTS